MNKKHYVFVYSTLRKSFWNHYSFEKSKFVEVVTKEKYNLYTDGIPYIVNPLIQIKDKLYQVDDETLKRLDLLKYHPRAY